MSEKTLVADIIAGNRHAFEQFVRQYEKLVAHVVFRMIRNETDREDVCQDVFVRVYRNLAGFQFQAKLSTWVARIAFNTAMNHLEKKKVDLFDDVTADHVTLDDMPDSVTGPDARFETADLGTRVRVEIDNLPVLYGTIMALYHLEDMPYMDIAGIMQMPVGTVKSYLFRGRKMLRERLVAVYSEEDLCL